MKKSFVVGALFSTLLLAGCGSNAITDEDIANGMIPMTRSTFAQIKEVDVDTFCGPVISAYQEYSRMVVARTQLQEKKESEGIPKELAVNSVVEQQRIVQKLEDHTIGVTVKDSNLEGLRKDFSAASESLIKTYNETRKSKNTSTLDSQITAWETAAQPMVMKCMEQS